MQLAPDDLLVSLGMPIDMIDQVIRRFPLKVGSLVLEAGCGTGKLGLSLASRTSCSVFLVDNDRTALERVFRHLFAVNGLMLTPSRVVCEYADILHLPYADGIFDLVFNEGVIEHFEDPTVVLKEMLRVSREGVLCIVPNARNKKQVELAKSQTEAYKGKQHWAAYEKPMLMEELVGFFEAAGLKEVETTLVFPDRIPPESRDDYRMLFALGRKR